MPREPSDETGDILARLLDLTNEQADVFRLVTARGPTAAAEAAKALGRNRARGYEIFEELVRRGLMTQLPGRPVRYEVVSIHRLLADKHRELAGRTAQLAHAMASLPQDVRLQVRNSVRLLTGTEEILAQAAALVHGAESEVVVIGKDCFQSTASQSLVQALRSKVEGTCEVSVYLDDSGPQSLLEVASDAVGRAPILYAASGFPDLAGVASEQGVLFMVPEATGTDGRAGVQVESRVIGEFCCLAIKQLLHPIKSKPLVDAKGDTLLASYKQALSEARRSIDIMVGAGWAQRWPRNDVENLCRLYVDALDKGIQVRILLQNSMPELLVAWEFGIIQRSEVRMAPAIPLLMCIIDEEVVLKGVGNDEEGVVSSIQTDDNEVRFSHEVFLRLWQSSIPLEKGVARGADLGGKRTTNDEPLA